MTEHLFASAPDGEGGASTSTSHVLGAVADALAALAAEDLGMDIEERVIDRTELYLADEVFFLGTGWEIMPVASIDRLSVAKPAPGALTKRIANRYAEIVRKGHPAYPGWRTPIWKGS